MAFPLPLNKQIANIAPTLHDESRLHDVEETSHIVVIWVRLIKNIKSKKKVTHELIDKPGKKRCHLLLVTCKAETSKEHNRGNIEYLL